MTVVAKLIYKLRQIGWLAQEMRRVRGSLERIQEALGRIETRQNAAAGSTNFDAHNFPVFSQWGEDGLLQFLIRSVTVPKKIFVEFGVQDYSEANTRFLLINDHWSGLVIEANAADVEAIKKDSLYWRYNLKAAQAFVTRENINELLQSNGVQGDIGVLSIDIDGNDYWVWEAISGVRPAVVIVEYNHRFGPTRAVSVPYRPDFSRGRAHPSMIYYGASLAALQRLGNRKGYALVGCTRAGNDAFFVRRDLLRPPLREATVEEAYVAGGFRESRDECGALLFLTPQEEQKLLSALPLVEIS